MIIKQRIHIAAVIVFVTCWSLWAISHAYARPNTQSSIDSFQFFIPYPADQLDDQFDISTVFQRKLPPNPPYQVNLRPVNGSSEPPVSGEDVTFNVTITNTSPSAIAALGLQYGFNPTHLSFLTASQPPDSGVPGQISWNNLLSNSNLPPASSLTASVTFLVANITAPLTSTQTISVSGAVLSNGTLLPPCVDTAEIKLTNPTPPPASTSVPPTAAPIPTPVTDDDDDNGSNPPPPPEAAASLPNPSPEAEAPTAVPAPIPVIILPETGQRSSSWLSHDVTHRILPVLPLLALPGFVGWMWLRRKPGHDLHNECHAKKFRI